MSKEKKLAQFYPLIMYYAKSFYHKISPELKRVIDIDDLFAEGVIGAILAIENYNKDKGSLISWVTLRAKGHVLDYIRKMDNISRKNRKKIIELIKREQELMKTLNRNPLDEELAENMNVSLNKIKEIRSWMIRHVSIENESIIDKEKKPDESTEIKELVHSLDACIKSDLTAEEAIVLIQRIIYDRTLEEMSRIINRSITTTHNRERRAKRKLKRCLKEKGWQEEDLTDIFT